MKLVSLADLKLRSREAADMVNSQFISDDELVRLINTSIQELYDVIIERFGSDYYVSPDPYEFTTSATNEAVDLPSDFYKCVGVDSAISGTMWTTVKPFNFAERNKFSSHLNGSYYEDSHFRYRIMGNKIRFTPETNGNTKMRVWYIPTAPELCHDTDELDGVNGYEELVVIDAAIKMKDKEESDVSVLMARKQMMLNRLYTAADNRDIGQSSRVSDVFNLTDGF